MAKAGRVFLRGMTSETYGLKEFRRRQLDAPRVRDDTVVVDDGKVAHSGDSAESRTWWRMGPGDDPFLTQSLQVHFVLLPPHSSNHGHGHQNEAAFYILEGAGYEIHDGQRYDWSTDDLVLVHTDSVHRHFNPYDQPALALVLKAKCAWMYLGLIQQGRTDVRNHSVDVMELEIPAGSRSGRRWHMADEVLYVRSGSGYSLHWEVQAEIADRYHARIAKQPTRHQIKPGDTLYVPQNTVAQHFAADGAPLRLLSAQNRLFKLLGYDKVVYLEHAPSDDVEAKAVQVAR